MPTSQPNRSNADSGEPGPADSGEPRPSDLPQSQESATSTQRRRRQRVQLEVERLRSEAKAARLEANAARLEASASEMEWVLQRIDAGEPIDPNQLSDLGLDGLDASTKLDAPSQHASAQDIAPETTAVEQRLLSPDDAHSRQSASDADDAPPTRFQSWDALRQAQQDAVQPGRFHASTFQGQSEPSIPSAHGSISRIDSSNPTTTPEEKSWTRTDSPHASVAAPRMRREQRDDFNALPTQEATTDAYDEQSTSKLDPDLNSSFDESTGPLETSTESSVAEIAPLELDDEATEAANRRRRPTAIAVSAMLHVLIVLFLAGLTLTTHVPKDQVALTASASESNESEMETFTIETSQPTAEPSPSEPTDAQYDVSDFGEMPSVDLTADITGEATPQLPAMSSLSSAASASATLKSLKSDSEVKMEFCGVEGGGNHFVYLVDSSGSMGDAFTSARSALLQSIDMLTEKQRFYVVFFDADCDYMRISKPDANETRSVYATTENKQRLRNWAMRISMDRGKAPYEPLRFALELRPDVIFLLSDGEFPQGIEDLLTEENKVSNLFGDEGPISILHTISYHSREGESRMRRIAEKNSGQYRHIPKP